jgi:hypothetical protein
MNMENTIQKNIYNETVKNDEIFNEISNSTVVNKVSNEFDDVKNSDFIVKPTDDLPTVVIKDLSNGTPFDIEFLPEEKFIRKEIDNKMVNVTEKVYEISIAEPGKPRTMDANGKKIEPSLSKDEKKKFYTTKLNITFDHSTYKSVLPTIKWYVNIKKEAVNENGKDVIKETMELKPWFNTTYNENVDEKFVSKITNLYFKLCRFLGKAPGDLTAQQFLKSLIGKKVRLMMEKGIYDGKPWTRIDIAEFVKE